MRFCKDTFKSLDSRNNFEVSPEDRVDCQAYSQIQITHSASWWLTSLDSPYFCALESAVEDVWGVKPLKIREGGTVPTIFWLEQEFQAPCVHLPLGQVSSSALSLNKLTIGV